MPRNKPFDYNIFKAKFCNEDIYDSLVNYYKDKYPNLCEIRIYFVVVHVSRMLIEEFKGPMLPYNLYSYCLINKALTKGLTDKEQEKFRWRIGIKTLQNCKEPTEDFMIKWLKENVGEDFAPDVRESVPVYAALVKELLMDRASVILSYVYNYLKKALSEELESNQMALPLPLQLLPDNQPEERPVLVRSSKKIKQTQFFEDASVQVIPKDNKGKKPSRKRQYDVDPFVQEGSPLKKKL